MAAAGPASGHSAHSAVSGSNQWSSRAQSLQSGPVKSRFGMGGGQMVKEEEQVKEQEQEHEHEHEKGRSSSRT